MRILIINADYPKFLEHFYSSSPGLSSAAYSEQLRARFDSHFGTANYYSRQFEQLGHQAFEVYANNNIMQSAWAREQGDVALAKELRAAPRERPFAKVRKIFAPWRTLLKPIEYRLGLSWYLNNSQLAILESQIEHLRPDVIFNQDVFAFNPTLLRLLRSPRRPALVGYIGKPVVGNEMRGYDLIAALLPSVCAHVRSRGMRALHSSLAFDPSILSGTQAVAEKSIDVSFIGTLSEEHYDRIQLLEAVAKTFKLELYAPGIDRIPSSVLRSNWKGQAWGRDMYDVISRSKITLNSHIDSVGSEAGNMRLYEATGVGTFLLTDARPGMSQLFEPGVHVATWRTPAECVEKIEYYLAHDAEREKIAAAGQKHTLNVHTYAHRAQMLAEAFKDIR